MVGLQGRRGVVELPCCCGVVSIWPVGPGAPVHNTLCCCCTQCCNTHCGRLFLFDLQTFMIPGSILINVLAGSMYSLPGEPAPSCPCGCSPPHSRQLCACCASVPDRAALQPSSASTSTARAASAAAVAAAFASQAASSRALCICGSRHPLASRPEPFPVPPHSRPAAATAFAATVDAAGASSNYWLARWLLRDVVAGLFPARVHAFALEVRQWCSGRSRQQLGVLAGGRLVVLVTQARSASWLTVCLLCSSAVPCGCSSIRPSLCSVAVLLWEGLTPLFRCGPSPCVCADAEAPGQPAQLQPLHPNGAHLPQVGQRSLLPPLQHAVPPASGLWGGRKPLAATALLP